MTGDRWRSEDARRARTRQRKRTEPHTYVARQNRADSRCLRCELPPDADVHRGRGIAHE